MPSLLKTKLLVIKSIPYAESSYITSFFTREAGMRSFIVGGVRGAQKKKKLSPAYFFPGTLLEGVVYDNPAVNLNRIKELSMDPPLPNIQMSVKKSSVLMFAAEVLQKTLKENEAMPDAFDQIRFWVLGLEHAEQGLGRFPLELLVLLANQLGFSPQNAEEMENELINSFIKVRSEERAALQHFFEGSFSQLSPLEKRSVFSLWIKLFQCQIENFGDLNTLHIFRTLEV